jgi:hypothetical protein
LITQFQGGLFALKFHKAPSRFSGFPLSRNYGFTAGTWGGAREAQKWAEKARWARQGRLLKTQLNVSSRAGNRVEDFP